MSCHYYPAETCPHGDVECRKQKYCPRQHAMLPDARTSNERSQWFIVLYEWQGCHQMTTDAAWWPSAEIMGAEVGALATVERLHRGEQPRRGQLTYRNIRGPFPWTEQPASAPETPAEPQCVCPPEKLPGMPNPYCPVCSGRAVKTSTELGT